MAIGRPTVYDVAERAGVSIATVSFAFRRPDKVRSETREVVLRVARELGYVPSGSARNLARGRTGVLGLHLFDLLVESATPLDLDPARPAPPARSRLTDLADLDLDGGLLAWDSDEDSRRSEPRTFPLYVDEVQRGFVLECKRNGSAVLLSTGGRGASEIADTAGQVDGLAILPGATVDASLGSVASTLPVVVLSSPIGDAHHVLADNAGGERMLVDHFVRTHGARSFGWIDAPAGFDTDERRTAFFDAVAAHPGASAEVLDVVNLERSPSFPELTGRIRAGALPDAVLCATDQLALATLDVLHAHGVDVPRQVGLAGFDGIQAARMSTPPLTTVRQPMELMGRLAAHLLLNDPADGTLERRSVRVEVELRIGGSCGCGVAVSR
ncbi:LacI family DNA-binding transcriptional regulator [Microbacterium thalli]|uniref:LacI family DNA-binding transcriptional regulator n=1 Tax=Microbacterium thalli TaxID=3027921 RepID=A0ABT5SG02_9MICO|nr:LacI family DNA-binding transcriptional regulator [Microbacterium thalli]MDD7929157.1 LacI family DNA-binding transcriptional regulator [Microbacterium thalli]MDD7961740.1 LacI family DNA-binding transcriptional regulator [Microbacterium thalli]MDN8549508.1 LacI family DNA-binding transcriptional regulator [Microbacterium thalli]